MTAVALPARTRGRAVQPARAPLRRPRRDHLVVVDAPRRVLSRRQVLIALGSIAVLALFTVVAFHALLAQSQVAIDRLERETTDAEQRYEEARYEYATQASPEHIVARAQELGLVPPDAPPTPVPATGELPTPPEDTAGTLNGLTEVKSTLADAP